MSKLINWKMPFEEEQVKMEELTKFEKKMIHSLMCIGMTWEQAFNEVANIVNKDTQLVPS